MAVNKDTISSNSSGGKCNTEVSQPSPSLYWCFTFNNYSLQDIEKFQSSDWLSKYVFQKEVGETGTPHLQGWLKLEKKRRLTALKKEFGDKPRWSKCSSTPASIKYCSDPDKRDDGTDVYHKGVKMKFADTLNTLKELRPWQQWVLDIVDASFTDRTINWFWEGQGNIGKTAFSRWMVIKRDAFYICGSAADMKCGLASYMEKNNGAFPRCVILDIPRDSIGCSYKGLEQIINGIFYSTKYESGMCVFNPPCVIVFANTPPVESRMSADRWFIRDLSRMKFDTLDDWLDKEIECPKC